MPNRRGVVEGQGLVVAFGVLRFRENVLIDGQLSGTTNQRLRVEEGTHTVKLENAEDYTPQWRRPTVSGTSVIKPMEVTFEIS